MLMCGYVYIGILMALGKLGLFSSAIDENNLGRPPRPGDLLQARIVSCWTTPHNSWHVVRRVAIFGPKGAGNCVNQPEQIMPPALTHTPRPEEMDTLCWGPSKWVTHPTGKPVDLQLLTTGSCHLPKTPCTAEILFPLMHVFVLIFVVKLVSLVARCQLADGANEMQLPQRKFSC